MFSRDVLAAPRCFGVWAWSGAGAAVAFAAVAAAPVAAAVAAEDAPAVKCTAVDVGDNVDVDYDIGMPPLMALVKHCCCRLVEASVAGRRRPNERAWCWALALHTLLGEVGSSHGLDQHLAPVPYYSFHVQM